MVECTGQRNSGGADERKLWVMTTYLRETQWTKQILSGTQGYAVQICFVSGQISACPGAWIVPSHVQDFVFPLFMAFLLSHFSTLAIWSTHCSSQCYLHTCSECTHPIILIINHDIKHCWSQYWPTEHQSVLSLVYQLQTCWGYGPSHHLGNLWRFYPML